MAPWIRCPCNTHTAIAPRHAAHPLIESRSPRRTKWQRRMRAHGKPRLCERASGQAGGVLLEQLGIALSSLCASQSAANRFRRFGAVCAAPPGLRRDRPRPRPLASPSPSAFRSPAAPSSVYSGTGAAPRASQPAGAPVPCVAREYECESEWLSARPWLLRARLRSLVPTPTRNRHAPCARALTHTHIQARTGAHRSPTGTQHSHRTVPELRAHKSAPGKLVPV